MGLRRKVVTWMALLLPAAVSADGATEARLRDALRATTVQLRTLEDEKARWKETETQLRGELETARGTAASASRRPPEANKAEVNRRLSAQLAANGKLQRALDACRARGEPKATPTAQAPAPAASDAEKERLGVEVKQLRQRVTTVETQNAELYKVGHDLLQWLTEIGVGGEPFLGWKRVELENVAQTYGDKLYQSRSKP